MDRIIDVRDYEWVETTQEHFVAPVPKSNKNLVKQRPRRDDRQSDKLAIEKRIRDVEMYLIDVFRVPMEQFELIEVYGKVNLVRFVPRQQFDPIMPIIYPYKQFDVDTETKVRHNIKRLNNNIADLSDIVWRESFDWSYWLKQVKDTSNILLDIFSDQLNDAEYTQYYNWLSDIVINQKGA